MAPQNSSGFRVASIQLTVTAEKSLNITNAMKRVQKAKNNGCTLAILPECFNSTYDTDQFQKYAEVIPGGETSKALSQSAKSNQIYIVAGSIPELSDGKLYNTCTVWDPNGNLIATHRKLHLFDVKIPGKIAFQESDVLTPGKTLNMFQVGKYRIGLGIGYDIRFSEMAALYQKKGCDMLIYPGVFCMTLGPLHWNIFARSRAVENQAFVALSSPARNKNSNYAAWGHSMVVDPWGKVLDEATEEDTDVYTDIDFNVRENMRKQVPNEHQRRSDVYDTIEVQK